MEIDFKGLCLSQGHVYPAEPAEAINRFTEDYSQADICDFFTMLLECALFSNYEYFKDGKDRINITLFCNRSAHALLATRAIYLTPIKQ